MSNRLFEVTFLATTALTEKELEKVLRKALDTLPYDETGADYADLRLEEVEED